VEYLRSSLILFVSSLYVYPEIVFSELDDSNVNALMQVKTTSKVKSPNQLKLR